MTFCHGFLQETGKVTSTKKKAIFIGFVYSLHTAGGKRKAFIHWPAQVSYSYEEILEPT